MNNNINKLDIEKLQQEIINIKKILLDYRVKQATKQPIKSHEIKKYKKELVRIITIEHQQIIKSNN
jgi:ribosomal protein L29|uniref:Ribosomal protein L29 n=1 Tax=Thorea hispida TaxID=202687 RepID=A0A1C9CAT0_9FLOR|nr:ribosomal protein L29 [Thorea hispida]AOM65477.1 ribosomal protein L29 [Thorea hispida]ARX95846.1 50S ribosomal protein L29 [Thorea hispida]UNJ79131.1 ribosomal protein L29 [Thorea hispida]